MEKLDGTNVGIHFTSLGRMILQCRGHEITEGMHPQFDLFKAFPMLLGQNKHRSKPVPEKVVLQLPDKLEPPTITEGHSLTVRP